MNGLTVLDVSASEQLAVGQLACIALIAGLRSTPVGQWRGQRVGVDCLLVTTCLRNHPRYHDQGLTQYQVGIIYLATAHSLPRYGPTGRHYKSEHGR